MAEPFEPRVLGRITTQRDTWVTRLPPGLFVTMVVGCWLVGWLLWCGYGPYLLWQWLRTRGRKKPVTMQ
jgi:hypothetical protein